MDIQVCTYFVIVLFSCVFVLTSHTFPTHNCKSHKNISKIHRI